MPTPLPGTTTSQPIWHGYAWFGQSPYPNRGRSVPEERPLCVTAGCGFDAPCCHILTSQWVTLCRLGFHGRCCDPAGARLARSIRGAGGWGVGFQPSRAYPDSYRARYRLDRFARRYSTRRFTRCAGRHTQGESMPVAASCRIGRDRFVGWNWPRGDP